MPAPARAEANAPDPQVVTPAAPQAATSEPQPDTERAVTDALADAGFGISFGGAGGIVFAHRRNRFATCVRHTDGWSVFIRDGAAPLQRTRLFVFAAAAVVQAALAEIPAAPVSVPPAREGVDL